MAFDLEAKVENLTIDRRIGFFMSNFEGLISLAGYTALYYAGVWIGQLVFRSRFDLKILKLVKRNLWNDFFRTKTLDSLLKLCVKFLILLFITYVLLLLSENFIQPASRRLANLSYCFWIVRIRTLSESSLIFKQFSRLQESKCFIILKCNDLGYLILNPLAYFRERTFLPFIFDVIQNQ